MQHEPAAVDLVRTSFQRLTNLLQDDTRAPAPHLCLSFASSYQVYTGISTIATTLQNEEVVREAVSIYSILVDSDEEALLENESFARELMRFIKNLTDGRLIRLGRQTEGEVLELAFSIAAKIRLEPDLLPVWFRPSTDATAIGTPPTRDNNAFPLCYQFVENVYNEGRAGDFARTGLLYIFESATHYNGLEDWIVNSDLPTMMASGLGALYSQLSRKISIAHPDDRLPLILALSDNDIHQVTGEADSFYSRSLQSRLTTFMSNLVFWQDILEHCRSLEIKQTLIDHFQVFFLQQILYPSLLESSDVDGGSSVAVLTYLWRILDSVDHPDLIHLILRYLLAISDSFTAARSGSFQATEKRKVSMKQRLEARGGDDTLNPLYFNLVDLLNASVRSKNVETITSALRLVTVMLNKHHQHAISSLVKSVPFRQGTLTRTMGSLRYDLDAYIDLAESIGGEEAMDEAYENCLKDASTLIESHVCSSTKIGLDPPGLVDSKRRGAILDNRPKDLHDHLLLPDDPLLHSLLDLLKTFFTNDIEINLGLTEVLSHLASCPYTRLEGWLVIDSPAAPPSHPPPADAPLPPNPTNPPPPSSHPPTPSDSNPALPTESDRIAAFKACATIPPVSAAADPPVLRILRDLDRQLAALKASIAEMGHFISGRKRAFQGATELENELRVAGRDGLNGGLGTVGIRSPKIPSRASSRGRAPPERTTSPAVRTAGASTLSPGLRERERGASPLKREIRAEEVEGAGVGKTEDAGRGDDAAEEAEEAEEEEIFERRLRFDGDGGAREATLNHVLTNVVILQEFVLEVAAVVQVRSSLLDGEVRFV